VLHLAPSSSLVLRLALERFPARLAAFSQYRPLSLLWRIMRACRRVGSFPPPA